VKTATAALLLSLPSISSAEIRLPALFSDHMVLEKTAKVPIWGKGDPGEEVAVTLDRQTVTAITGTDGRWKTALDLSASPPGPFLMTVRGKNTITITDVLVGEVWVAAGQSNMEFKLGRTIDAADEIAASANPLLRQFSVPRAASWAPEDDCEGKWEIASPETAASFSAVAYAFGKTLQNELKAPVGLLHISWGGSPSEAWTSRPALESVPDLKAATDRISALVAAHPEEQKRWAAAFGKWLEANHRQDRPTKDAAKYAAPDAPLEDWRKVTIPGPVATETFSGDGAVWVRRDIMIEEPATAGLAVELGAIEGFDSVYWNGELLASLAYRDYPGSGYVRTRETYSVPAGKVKAGKNTLAVRIFAPGGPARFPTVVRLGGKRVTEDWLATEEFRLLALSGEQLANMPRPPRALPITKTMPSLLFNGMVHPVLPYAVSGIIWYQGEANAARAYQYRTAFPLLISDWRKAWGQGELPFYFCQLANYQPKKSVPEDSNWAELREAQSMALSLPATGQAVLIDIGEAGDIHPRNKKEVGERLARIALARGYGRNIPFSGPVYDSATFEDGKAKISFRHTNGGLVAKPVPPVHCVASRDNTTAPTVRNSPNSELEGFAICGADRQWVWADARIEGNQVYVCSDKVPAPVAVRYGWADNPTVNLCNGAGLPASPFRTDDFPPATLDGKYGPPS
jgi:sialate O-acetylesterase